MGHVLRPLDLQSEANGVVVVAYGVKVCLDVRAGGVAVGNTVHNLSVYRNQRHGVVLGLLHDKGHYLINCTDQSINQSINQL